MKWRVVRMSSEWNSRVRWMKITDTAITTPRRKRRDPKFESKKSREQEVSAAVKNPHKIEFEIESSPSKFAGRKYLQNKWEDRTPAKGARIQRQCSKGWAHCKSRQRRQEWHRKTEPENTKNWRRKLQNWRNKASLFERLEAPWRDTHNADPGGKKERILTELTELTVTKTHPICGLW